ncbi:MAG TPA: hypothetical protein VHN79_13435 [Lacunisphaera sp.]|nr:hypothetical protein [Lacunisphaera sp.]
MNETYDSQPPFAVTDAEYHRLLGYPRGHEPGERVRELKAGARAWFAGHGRPWLYLRRVELETGGGELRLEGVPFSSPQLHAHLRRHGARSAVLLAVSAGAECEEEARRLWTEGKPDEYFFLEMFGSAVVEDLVARASGRTCEVAGAEGLRAIPHYSPGYTGWDVAEQNKLFALVAGGMSRPFPGPIEVLSSGMLRPKKSLLAVFGLAPGRAGDAAAAPCENCGFTPCNYRRAPYRHAAGPVSDRTADPSRAGSIAPRYSVNARALRKWATERVSLLPQADGTLEAIFRFDGTTCSHQPLAFDYRVRLNGATPGSVILGSSCAPAPEDEGHKLTCSYLAGAEDHLHEIAADRPLVGRPLEEVFAWSRESAPAGCHCAPASRAHKWGLALEAIHYALVQAHAPQTVS